MQAVLPKQFEPISQRNRLVQADLPRSLFLRIKKGIEADSRSEWEVKCARVQAQLYRDYASVSNTHTLEVTNQNGIERMELKAKKASALYVIHYPGNGEDAMNFFNMTAHIQSQKYAGHHHVFWNYPGVEDSAGKSMSVFELIAAGMQQVQDLLDRGVPLQNITLYGRSLGGGVASQVASRFSQHDHCPNLDIERSFSSISAVPLAILRTHLYSKYPAYEPFFSAILGCSIVGISMGLITAGIVATLGLLMAALIAALGYSVAIGLQTLRSGLGQGNLLWIDTLATCIHTCMTRAAIGFNWLINWVASGVGALVAVIGLLVGIILGLVIGVVPTLYLYMTQFLPDFGLLKAAFRLIAVVSHVEMDSVAAIQHVLAHTQHNPKITVTNVEDDKVILVDAALNTGLQFRPETNMKKEEQLPLRTKVHSFWYKFGGHNEPMKVLGRSNSINTAPRV